MPKSSFTMAGFTRPDSAMSFIEDTQNNGFTSRLLWYFSEPVYCRLQDTILDQSEKDEVDTFQQKLGIHAQYNNSSDFHYALSPQKR